jgi:glycosyltransferase involved in cell wall biosynthesis
LTVRERGTYPARAAMKLAMITGATEISSSRIRVHQMVPWLEELGIRCRLHAYPENAAERRRLRLELRDADLVLLHKRLPSFAHGLWLRGIGRPIVFDYDDAVFLRQHKKRGGFGSLRRSRRFRRAVAISSGVIAGNDYLASRAGSNRPVLVAPSPVPIDVPQMHERAPNDVLRVGWVGLALNLGYVAALEPALRELASRRRFRLVIVSNADNVAPGIEVENVRWTLERQEAEIARFDVGIMPLELDSPWSKGKCAYKLLQYMAGGVPVVGSRVGMNAQVIEDGVNGFLVESDAQWVAVLERLLDDAQLRARIGRAGRRTAVERFSYPVVARAWADFLARVLAASGAPQAFAPTRASGA